MEFLIEEKGFSFERRDLMIWESQMNTGFTIKKWGYQKMRDNIIKEGVFIGGERVLFDDNGS